MAYTHEVGRRFWFEFDRATLNDAAFMNAVVSSGAGRAQNEYRTARQQGTYPASFRQKFTAHRADWIRIADRQTSIVTQFLGTDWADIQSAFEDFGQGILVDTDPDRVADNNAIHMMDGQADDPPVGYHRWHASIRAIQLLGIGDADWFEKLDRLVGLGWAVQSLAKPVQQATANPGLSGSDLQALRDAWLNLTPERRDHQYDLTAGPVGFHPSPKAPG